MKYNVKEVKTIISRSKIGTYTANPYVGCEHRCVYCYANYMCQWTGHDNDNWGEFLDVKHWNSSGIPNPHDKSILVIGTVTDPYGPCEETFCRTGALLNDLIGKNYRIMIMSKSDLVLRDLDLLKQLDASVALTINTTDEKLHEEQDEAPSISRRLEALRVLHENGIHTQVLCSPVFPALTDVIGVLQMTRPYIDVFNWDTLNLRGCNRKSVVDYINKKHPELSRLYYEIYNLNKDDYWKEMDSKLHEFCIQEKCDYITGIPMCKRLYDNCPFVVRRKT